MNETQIILTSITLSIVGWVLAFKLVLLPSMQVIPVHRSLLLLTLPHIFRYVGLGFLIPGVTTAPLDARFAQTAAYGDLLSAVLALLAVVLLARESRGAIAATLVFNIIGFTDLIYAVTQGLRFTEPSQMGATFFIPTLAVPPLLVTHILIFKFLLHSNLRAAIR